MRQRRKLSCSRFVTIFFVFVLITPFDFGYYKLILRIGNSQFTFLKLLSLTLIAINPYLDAFDCKPCLIYGSRIKHPKFKSWNDVLFFDNGSTETYLHPYGEDNFVPRGDKVKNTFKEWSPKFYMIVVAFGLSYLRHDREIEEWDDSQYESINTDKKLIEVPRQRNEGFYICNVIKRKLYDRD